MDEGIGLAGLSLPVIWMLGSAGLALPGFVGGQLLQMLVGARSIATREAGASDYSATEEVVLSGWLANKGFKGFVRRRTLGTPLGKLFFWAMGLGLAAHIAFWVVATTVLDLDAL